MHDGMPYGRNQGQGQGHSREVDRQSPTGLIFTILTPENTSSDNRFNKLWGGRHNMPPPLASWPLTF